MTKLSEPFEPLPERKHPDFVSGAGVEAPVTLSSRAKIVGSLRIGVVGEAGKSRKLQFQTLITKSEIVELI